MRGTMLQKAKTLIRPVAYRVINAFGRMAVLRSSYVSGKLLPLGGDKTDYIVSFPESTTAASNGPPVPPRELWEGYGDSPEAYLAGGRQDISSMLDILKTVGESPQTLCRVLDFGSAAGRMLRFYPYIPGKSELWGVDINAKAILWSQQHMSPPLLFATTTTAPHLPFEDNYFDLVYAGSVFTHITDLADAWFLELRRILRKGGYAFISIQDKHSVDLLFSKFKDEPLYVGFVDMVRRFEDKTSIQSQNYAWFSIRGDPTPQVFYDAEYLVKKWSHLASVVSVTEEGHGFQTALLFQK